MATSLSHSPACTPACTQLAPGPAPQRADHPGHSSCASSVSSSTRLSNSPGAWLINSLHGSRWMSGNPHPLAEDHPMHGAVLHPDLHRLEYRLHHVDRDEGARQQPEAIRVPGRPASGRRSARRQPTGGAHARRVVSNATLSFHAGASGRRRAEFQAVADGTPVRKLQFQDRRTLRPLRRIAVVMASS